MSKVVGMDLDATFPSIAMVNQYGKPEIIPNREGGNFPEGSSTICPKKRQRQ